MKKNKILKIIGLLLLIVLLCMFYNKNIIDKYPLQLNFQQDSEDLVLSAVLCDKLELKDNKKYGLLWFENSNNERVGNITDIDSIEKSESIKKLNIVDYKSQYGMQGFVFSYLYNKMNISIYSLRLMCCIILSVIIVVMCYCIAIKYNKLMGAVFYITFLLSPWVIAFAPNLYWVEFTWLLPILFGILLSIYNNKKVLLPCIFVSVLIKCLCGYEYITTIMIGTEIFLIIDLFKSEDRKEIIKKILLVGVTCILAFFTAILIHASIRGNGNVIDGVKKIYHEDVLRRTIITTDKENYSGKMRASMDASILSVVTTYFKWDSDIIIGISGKYFEILICIASIIFIYNIIKAKKNSEQEITMFLLFFIATLSWYVLGKSHSYIHTHMNYVLWYFGFIQICIYIIIKFLRDNIVKVLKKGSK